MSIVTTWRAIFVIWSVNQPSPEHRSSTSMPARIPTLASTPPVSGHNASHQPAVGISVPSKNPGGLSVTAAECLTLVPNMQWARGQEQ